MAVSWLLLVADAVPSVPFTLSVGLSQLLLGVAGVGSLALVTLRCQRPVDEVYEAAFRAGEQYERRRWLAAKSEGARTVVPLRRTVRRPERVPS